MYLNKVLLIGNLTRDPELRALPSGVKVTTFGMATNRTWKGQDGTKQEATEYHNLVAFAKPAELIAQYCKKGSSLYAEGRLQTRTWDDKTSGEKKYRTEIVIENFQFGPRPQNQGPTTGVYRAEENKAKEKKAVTADDIETIEYPTEDVSSEDIPF